MELKEKISEMLEIRDMIPAELARNAKISPGLLSNILSGKRESVNIDTAKKMAKALGVHVLYLIEEEGHTIGPTEILRHLPEKDRAFVINETSAPFIKLTARAAKEGLTPEQLDFLISAVLKHSK